MRLACQLWSVNDIWKSDPAGTLAKLRGMGYEGVQSMAFWKWDRKELHRLLDGEGMRLVDMPVDLGHVGKENLGKTVEFCKEFGIDFVFVPWYKSDTEDGWRKLADDMAAAADRLAPHGIRMGFHNHQVEFTQKFAGTCPMEMFFEKPQLSFELDVGHATLAGRDPVELLKGLGGRVPSIHAKPGGGKACGGEGDRNDWGAIFAACRGAGVKWAVVECETERNTFAHVEATMRHFKSYMDLLDLV